MNTATGFDLQPLPDGNVLIEFQADDGKTINQQIVTAEVVRQMPLVAALLDVALQEGPEVAREIMEKLNMKERGNRIEYKESETIMTVFVVERLDLSDHTVAIRIFATETKARAYLVEVLTDLTGADVSGMSSEQLEACLASVEEEQGYRFSVYGKSVDS